MQNISICKRCVLDTSIPELVLGKDGICNFCRDFDSQIDNYILSKEQVKEKLANLSRLIKQDGGANEFNCIMGMSGGVDSSYVAHLAGQLELKPLVVHLDNSWNSEIAVKNVKNIVSKLDFKLHTHVINWKEFKDLQKSYFKASVVDLEVPTDHAITAIIYKLATRHGIKHVLSGGNYRTEHGLPRSWRWDKLDLRNLRHIHKSYGTVKLESYPTINNLKFNIWHRGFLRINQHLPLNFVNFKRNAATELLKQEYDWRDYGGKHHESLFTKFYQSHVLPKKYNIDKRKAHLSCLIRNFEMDRTEALNILQAPAYSNEDLAIERPYVLKKLGFSEVEFENFLEEKANPHESFKNEQFIKDFLHSMKNLIRAND